MTSFHRTGSFHWSHIFPSIYALIMSNVLYIVHMLLLLSTNHNQSFWKQSQWNSLSRGMQRNECKGMCLGRDSTLSKSTGAKEKMTRWVLWKYIFIYIECQGFLKTFRSFLYQFGFQLCIFMAFLCIWVCMSLCLFLFFCAFYFHSFLLFVYSIMVCYLCFILLYFIII